MPLVSRIGDSVFGHGSHGSDCCPHSGVGTIITGAPSVLSEGSPTSRVTDIGIHPWCPHCSIFILDHPVPNIMSEGLLETGLSHTSNEICGRGVIITSSKTVWSGF